jgi:hypothetical protein
MCTFRCLSTALVECMLTTLVTSRWQILRRDACGGPSLFPLTFLLPLLQLLFSLPQVPSSPSTSETTGRRSRTPFENAATVFPSLLRPSYFSFTSSFLLTSPFPPAHQLLVRPYPVPLSHPNLRPPRFPALRRFPFLPLFLFLVSFFLATAPFDGIQSGRRYGRAGQLQGRPVQGGGGRDEGGDELGWGQ